MNRKDFKAFIERELENAIEFAERHTGTILPRSYCFRWIFKTELFCENIPEVIAGRVWEDEDHIRPCVDLIVMDFITDDTLMIEGIIAGFAARPFGKNWAGRDGPFIYGVSQALVDKLQSK